MSASLRIAIARGDYTVDPDAVAEAMLRRARAGARIPLVPSEVLVPVHLFEDLPLCADKLRALTGENCA